MKKNNKNEKITFRCTKSEKKIIFSLAEKCGLTASDYCRKQARYGEVLAIPKLNSDEIEYMRTLKIYSSHFNRISNLIKEWDPSLVEEVRALVKEFTELQKRLI